MTEVELRQGASLADQMNFARLVADGSILPDAYRRNPSNVLIAVGLGQAMGLSPAESLYRINVIKGKPTAGAELIAANVRRAGHTLRVTSTSESATATIIRSDDPGFEHIVTRDKSWAQQMGLASNDNYRKQPETMLQWRAITAVARLACPDALYGVSYTPDEMFDMSRSHQGEVVEGEVSDPEPVDVTDAEVLEDNPEPVTAKTRGHLFALFAQKGVAEADQLPGANHINGTRHESRADITEAEALAVINVLRTRPDAGADS